MTRAPCILVTTLAACTAHAPDPLAISANDEPQVQVAPRDLMISGLEKQPLDADPTADARAGDSGPHDRLDDDRAATYEGVFDIDRAVGGKALQASWLVTGDGSRYVLSYRPMSEHLDKLGKRVVVRGIDYWPEGQHISADHLKVVSMRLADGETPHATPPITPPPPPQVRTGGELRVRSGRAAQVVGTLRGARGEDHWQEVELVLDDGTVVSTTEAESIVDSVYRPRFGARVTLLGEILEKGGRFVLDTATVCEGEVADCGFGTPSVLR